MKLVKGRLFIRKYSDRQTMLLGIIAGSDLPSFTNEMLHDAMIIDDGVSITITIQRTGTSANDHLVKHGRADQILCGAFMMEGESHEA